MKKRNITPLDVYRMCYRLPPDLQVSVYSTRLALPDWQGEFRAMPLKYRNATIDSMDITAKESKVVRLTFVLQGGLDKDD